MEHASRCPIEATDKQGLVDKVIDKVLTSAAYATVATVRTFGMKHHTLAEEHDYLTEGNFGSLILTARLTLEDGTFEDIEVCASAVACRDKLREFDEQL